MAQALSIRTDLIPETYALELRQLQPQCDLLAFHPNP